MNKIKNLAEDFLKWTWSEHSDAYEAAEESQIACSVDNYPDYYWEDKRELVDLELDESDKYQADLCSKIEQLQQEGYSDRQILDGVKAASEVEATDMYRGYGELTMMGLGEQEVYVSLDYDTVGAWCDERGVTLEDLEKALGWQHQDTTTDYGFSWLELVPMDYTFITISCQPEDLDEYLRTKQKPKPEEREAAERAEQERLETLHAISQSPNVYSLSDWRRRKTA